MASRPDHFVDVPTTKNKKRKEKKNQVFTMYPIYLSILKCFYTYSTALVFHYHRLYYLGGLRALNVQISCSSAGTKTGDEIEFHN